ncbi:transposase [Streptomyces marokkonensis]|uniref:transposase n=2 Tax=Streptomyces TaxID=1883 RepID=UPI003CD073E4
MIDGMWRTRAGAPWRDVPERYGPWGRVYDLSRRWQRDGIRKRAARRGRHRAGRPRARTLPRPTRGTSHCPC